MRPPPTRIGNGGRYFRTNASMGPESTSSDTPAISKSLRSNSRYSSAMCGNSSRQGSHHDAQKFTSVTLPRNFWASWCDPCREEFPHMAELYRDFDRRDFEIAAISDDVDRGKMRAFVQQFRPPFPILVGGGRMKQAYHYRGLPYSVLLDRRGRVIERIFGFGGADEFRELHETIANEVRAP